MRYTFAALLICTPLATYAADDSLLSRLTQPGPLSEHAHALEEMQAENASSQKTLVPELTQALESKNPAVRKNAAEALGALDNQGQSAVDDLREAQKDPSEEVRRTAAISLARLGHGDQTLVNQLISNLEYTPSPIGKPGDTQAKIDRYDAADAIGFIASGPRHIDLSSTVPALSRTVKNDPDDDVRNRAAWALGTMGRQASKALPALRTAARRPESSDVASWAIDEIQH